MPFQFPRARGAANSRAPQIGPGTFEGRVAPDGVKPGPFQAIAYLRDLGAPEGELWCFLKSEYNPIGATGTLWLDLVPEPSAFVPPLNPIGLELENALKAYASARFNADYSPSTSPSAWEVHPARQTPISTPTTEPRKLGLGVYEVTQRALDFLHPRAWVWVTDAGSREVWLLYRPGEVGGYSRVGTFLPTGVKYSGTELMFDKIGEADEIEVGGSVLPLDTYQFGQSISNLRQAIVLRPGSLVVDPIADLLLENWYVGTDQG